jgi:hypothetical protein
MHYNCELTIEIQPLYCKEWPYLTLGLDDQIIYNDRLSNLQTFTISKDLDIAKHYLWIKFSGKTNENTNASQDQALIIKKVSFENITSDRFKWAAKYYPTYPQPWANEQKANNIDLPAELMNQDYLGWNGIWKLEFTVPVFTWIHKIDNLGLIYS